MMNSDCLIDNTVPQNNVLLTIAIPTFKRFELLKETLDSVFRLSFSISIEVIVVDNDPQNKEVALHEMKKYSNCNFKYYKNHENYGIFGNWNQCIDLATGKFITILHDDDLLDEEFAIQANKNLVDTEQLIFGFGISILDQRTEANKVEVPLVFKILKKIVYAGRNRNRHNTCVKIGMAELFWRNIFSGTLGVIMLREHAKMLRFDEKMYPIADYDFWIRWITNFGAINYIPCIVGFYRIRENESFRPDVISGFIKKNIDLRQRILKQYNLEPKMKGNVELMEKIDEFNCNYLLRSKSEFIMTWTVTIEYLYLKLRVIVAKFKTSTLWRDGPLSGHE